jgi:nicotinate-nucleotide adenylyltransferase
VRIGLLGGTFDPFHNGHLAAAEAAIVCAHLDRVVFIPAALPPHRPPAVAKPEQRLEMARLSTEGDARFTVSDVELKRGGPSYTADTLTHIREHRPDDELFLILGWDAARLFLTWHKPDEVRELATSVVVAGPRSESPGEEELEGVGLDKVKTVLCLRATPDISASEIRSAVVAGKPITGKVPPAVERYIASHRLYTG